MLAKPTDRRHGRASTTYPLGPHFRIVGDVTLNPDVTWTIRIRSGAGGLDADLTQVRLSAIDIDGGASQVTLHLPPPGDITGPVRIGGGSSHVTVLRPAGVMARLNVSRGATDLAFDEQRFGAIGGEIQLTEVPVTGACWE